MASKRAWKKRRKQAMNEGKYYAETSQMLGQMQGELEEMKKIYPKFYKEYMDLKEYREKKYLIQFIRLREELKDGIVKLYKKGMGNELGVKYLKMHYNELTDILEDYGVEIWESDEGEKFDPEIHKIVAKVETSEEKKHGMIVEVVSSGYKWRELVLKKMGVTVYCYK